MHGYFPFECEHFFRLFSGAYVTDRPNPAPPISDNITANNDDQNNTVSPDLLAVSAVDQEQVTPKQQIRDTERKIPSTSFTPPDQIRPFPKAGLRQETRELPKKKKHHIY